jgi:hypothetical protein
MSLDESIGKIEVNPKEEASVVVLDKLSDMKFPSSLVKRLRRISVETRLKGYRYFEIERDFFNKLGVLIDGDFKFGVGNFTADLQNVSLMSLDESIGKIANLMHSQCALSESISSSRKTRKLTVYRFI